MNRRTKETQSNAGINSALQGGGRPKVKSFGQKSWMLSQPVLIIGTYDKRHTQCYECCLGVVYGTQRRL